MIYYIRMDRKRGELDFMKALSFKKLKKSTQIAFIVFFLFNCTPSSDTNPNPDPTSLRARATICPEKEDCNIDNYKKHIYSPGVRCDLNCVKVSEVNTTNWAWNNIPSGYSNNCNILKEVKLISTFFVCAGLTGLNLSEKDLTDANLSGANLAYANLKGAILKGTNMRETTVVGANLDTDLTTADLTGAVYNKKTKFPENFSPKSKNMVSSDFDDFGNRKRYSTIKPNKPERIE